MVCSGQCGVSIVKHWMKKFGQNFKHALALQVKFRKTQNPASFIDFRCTSARDSHRVGLLITQKASSAWVPNLFTISYHLVLGTPHCQRVPLLPEQLIWSSLSLFGRINTQSNNNKRPQLNLVRFMFTFHQLVDAWRKFANSASKVIMLRHNRNNKLQKNLFV